MTSGEWLATFALLRVPRRVRPLRRGAARVAQCLANFGPVGGATRARIVEAYHANVGGRPGRVLLKDGFEMSVIGEDCIQRRIMLFGPFQERVWEPNTALLLRRLAQLGNRFLVAGGHVGYFPLLLATASGGRDSVVCTFEPNERQRRQLLENVANNQMNNVRVDDRALADQSGQTVEFYSDESANVCSSIVVKGSTGYVVTATTVRIDDYCIAAGLPGLDLIVLDIEGGEPEAIQGAGDLLRRPPDAAPDLVFELVPGRRSAADHDGMLAQLTELGYELFLIDDPFDYEVASRTLDCQVPLIALGRPDVSEVKRLAEARKLNDPNIFATKKGLSRLGSVVQRFPSTGTGSE